MITDLDKLKCVERELAMRRNLYRNWVRYGLMREEDADREMALMEAIVVDYRAKVQPALALDA